MMLSKDIKQTENDFTNSDLSFLNQTFSLSINGYIKFTKICLPTGLKNRSEKSQFPPFISEIIP